MNKTATINQIAKEELKLETLESRKSDRLDFPENIAVWNIKKALERAYEAGAKSKDKFLAKG